MANEMSAVVVAVQNKITKLNNEIATLKLKKTCPFYGMFGDKIKCPYKDGWNVCYDIEVATGNSDAWCVKMIEHGIDATKKIYFREEKDGYHMGVEDDDEWVDQQAALGF